MDGNGEQNEAGGRRAARRRGRRGAVLPSVLITCLITATAASIAISLSMSRYNMMVRTLRAEQAAAAAEGGAEIAVARIAAAEASGASVGMFSQGTIGGTAYSYQIIDDRVKSTALVRGVDRVVSIYGVAHGYWCKYAYFANYFNSPNANGTAGSPIWLITGDRIRGETHCNHDIYIAGNPVFDGSVSLSGSIVANGGTINSPAYSNGTPRIVTPISLSAIDFTALKANAQQNGIVVEGAAAISVNGTELRVATSTQTNTYTIGPTDHNIVYVANGMTAVPGAGRWVGRIVTNSVAVWRPGSVQVTTIPAHYAAGIAQGNALVTSEYTDDGDRYKWTSKQSYGWGTYFLYRYRTRTGWSGQYSSYDERQVSVPARVYSDYKTTAHTDWEAKPWYGASWSTAWVGSYYRSNWVAAVSVTNVTASNLVSVATNYVEQTWVPDTNANISALGDVTISGVLSRGLTIAAEHNIRITGNLIYTNDAGNGAAYTSAVSDVMCALISGADVIVANPSPSTQNQPREIHASIMATGTKTGSAEGDPYGIDGRFYVENYSLGRYKGVLTVFGGIIQNWRGAVGTFSGQTPRTGYTKNYIYDTRFGPSIGKGPPSCPMIDVRFRFDRWVGNTKQ